MVIPSKIGFSIGITQQIARSVLILFFLVSGFSEAQYTPLVQNYPPEQYGADNQNWVIEQSNSGMLFVANQSRVLLYDGNRWESVFVPNAQNIRSIKVVEDRLYVGGSMSIGFYQITPRGLEDYSEIKGLEHQNIDVGEEFWNITWLEERLFLQSKRAIYEVVDNQLTLRTPFESDRPESFSLKGDLYFFSSKEALRFSAGEYYRFEFPELSSAFVGIYERNEAQFLVNEIGETFRFNRGVLIKEANPFVDLKNSDQIYDLIQLRNDYLVVGTISSGLHVYDAEGNLLYVLDKRSGLNNNTVLGLFQSVTGRVWVALDQGIASFIPNSNLSEFRFGFGDIGVVYTATNYQNNLYIGTNQGLYLFNKELNEFEFVSGTRGQVWNLKALGNQLYCFHDKGLFKIKDLKASLVDAQTGYWNASEHVDSKGVSSYVLGGYNGVYIYRPTRNPVVEKVNDFNTPSRFVELLDDVIVVNHESLGVFLLDFDWNNLVVRSEKQIPALGTASSLFLLNDQLYYKSSEGVFSVEKGALRYHRELTSLISDPIARPAQNSYRPDEVSFLSKQKIVRLRITNNGEYAAIEEFLPETRLASFGVSGFENINAIGSHEYLTGLKDGFIVLDTNLNDEKPTAFPIWPLTLEVARQDEFVSLLPEEPHLLKAEESTIRVRFTHPSFSERHPVTYEYQLTSERDTITDRSLSTVKTYYNLQPGRYSLSTKAIGISGETLALSKPIRFEIDKPWYQTVQFTLYLIFSGLIISFVASALVRAVYKRRERKIREENERLLETNQLREENRISQLKNKHLENELELRKRELTGVYEAEIRRNALLKDLKSPNWQGKI
jgi:hypothetical protein